MRPRVAAEVTRPKITELITATDFCKEVTDTKIMNRETVRVV